MEKIDELLKKNLQALDTWKRKTVLQKREKSGSEVGSVDAFQPKRQETHL